MRRTWLEAILLSRSPKRTVSEDLKAHPGFSFSSLSPCGRLEPEFPDIAPAFVTCRLSYVVVTHRLIHLTPSMYIFFSFYQRFRFNSTHTILRFMSTFPKLITLPSSEKFLQLLTHADFESETYFQVYSLLKNVLLKSMANECRHVERSEFIKGVAQDPKRMTS